METSALIDVTNNHLFESILQFCYNDLTVDLHNDYKCYKYIYDSQKQEFLVSFKEKKGEIFRVSIWFKYAIIKNLSYQFIIPADHLTLDNFYRGRFEENGKLFETSSLGNYYYIDFVEGINFELFAKEVQVFLDREI